MSAGRRRGARGVRRAPQVYDLADALVAGDLRSTLALAEELESYGERPGRLVFPVVRRLREVHRAAALLDSGMPDAKVAEALKAPPWLAKKTVTRAKKADRLTLERAMCVFADLEIEMRGGGAASARRGHRVLARAGKGDRRG